MPFFFTYCVWDISSNASTEIFIKIYQNTASYRSRFIEVNAIETLIDSALLFCVLVELGWSVLRPVRSSLSHRSLILIAALILLAGAAIWPFTGLSGFAHAAPRLWLLKAQLQHTVSILRILFFLLLAGGSQLLSIGWRDRELQVATGLGFYSLTSLVISGLQARQISGMRYLYLNRIAVICFICSLIYWLVCFAQQEAERRAFTPEMQRILLSVAGTARATRVALTEPQTDNPRK